MTLLIFYAALAIGVSFLCSILEACLLSLPQSTVEELAERGSKAGRTLRNMKENIDQPLAAILTLNTIAHTIGAAGVGAQATIVFGSGAVGIASAVMTLLILVLSEIIPKTLGAVHAKTLAIPTAIVTHWLTRLCLPILIPLGWVNRAIGYERHTTSLERSELQSILSLGQRSGALEKREYRIVSNLMALSSIQLSKILTPRTVLFSLPEEMTVSEVTEQHHPLSFARIPVYAEDPDHASRYVTRFAIQTAQANHQGDRTLKELSTPLAILPEYGTVGDALEKLLKEQQNIALIIDEYGGTAGIVTLEDLLETLLGEEIVDETDTAIDMQELARSRIKRAREQ